MLRCWWEGHKKLEIPALQGNPVIAIHTKGDEFAVCVEMCVRCNVLYWMKQRPMVVEKPLLITDQRGMVNKGGIPDGKRWS